MPRAPNSELPLLLFSTPTAGWLAGVVFITCTVGALTDVVIVIGWTDDTTPSLDAGRPTEPAGPRDSEAIWPVSNSDMGADEMDTEPGGEPADNVDAGDSDETDVDDEDAENGDGGCRYSCCWYFSWRWCCCCCRYCCCCDNGLALLLLSVRLLVEPLLWKRARPPVPPASAPLVPLSSREPRFRLLLRPVE